jgi:hypothetical protein
VPHAHIHQKVARVAGRRGRGNWECGLGGGKGPRGVGMSWGSGRQEKQAGRETGREREREREREGMPLDPTAAHTRVRTSPEVCLRACVRACE